MKTEGLTGTEALVECARWPERVVTVWQTGLRYVTGAPLIEGPYRVSKKGAIQVQNCFKEWATAVADALDKPGSGSYSLIIPDDLKAEFGLASKTTGLTAAEAEKALRARPGEVEAENVSGYRFVVDRDGFLKRVESKGLVECFQKLAAFNEPYTLRPVAKEEPKPEPAPLPDSPLSEHIAERSGAEKWSEPVYRWHREHDALLLAEVDARIEAAFGRAAIEEADVSDPEEWDWSVNRDMRIRLEGK